MTLNEYQFAAATTAIYPNRGSNLTYPVLGLVGEAGELANKLKKVFRDDDGEMRLERREQMARELGDILWYCAAVATELEIDLEHVAKLNIAALADRAQRGAITGSGDNR